MFWKRKDSNKLSKPQEIPEFVKKQINPALIDPDVLPFLQIVTKHNSKGEKSFDFRIFDPADAEARHLKVDNFSSLDGADELILGDGSYEEQAKTAVINIKHKFPKCKFFTLAEIQTQIENLHNPDDQAFFYAAAGGGAGGPLGRGANVVKINVSAEGKKRKKYGIYSCSVINMEPVVKKEDLVWDSDKPQDIAKWIAESHKARFC